MEFLTSVFGVGPFKIIRHQIGILYLSSTPTEVPIKTNLDWNLFHNDLFNLHTKNAAKWLAPDFFIVTRPSDVTVLCV